MTSSTGGGGGWPFERVGDPGAASGGTFGRTGETPERPVAPSGFGGTTGFGAAAGRGGTPPVEHASGGGRRGNGGEAPPARRRPPMWLLVVIGLVVVGGVVAVILMLTAKDETAEVLPAETLTLPVPTPTVDPIAREAGTTFSDVLPSTVLAFALTDIAEYEPGLATGAVEAWQLGYTDGAQAVVLYAAQYADAATAEAALDQVLVANPVETAPADDAAATEPPADEATAGATATPTTEPVLEPELGTVEVDGAQAGRFLFLPRADGTGSLWWTNATVLLQLDGPAAELRDLFAAFPL